MKHIVAALFLICFCTNPLSPDRSQLCGFWESDTSFCREEGTLISDVSSYNTLDITADNLTLKTYLYSFGWRTYDGDPCTLTSYRDTFTWFCAAWKIKKDTLLMLDVITNGTMVNNFRYPFTVSGDKLLLQQHDRGCLKKTWFNYKRKN